MKFNEEETKQYAAMMEWASDNKKIKKFSCYYQNNAIFIVANYNDGKVVQGNSNVSLMEAMQGYSKSAQMTLTVTEALK